MFSSKSKEAATPSAPMVQSPQPQQKRPMRSGSAPSIISADLVVHGTLTSSGDIQIDGKVEGNVNSTGLVIGDKAYIQGDVMAEDVTIRGRVKGAIRARKVLLASTCHVEGDILHEAFAVETGAFFEGNCRHADNPLADDGRGRSVAASNAPTAPITAAPVTSMSRPADATPLSSTPSFAPAKTGS